MNNTMVRKFCTLQEAAEQLDSTPEQIESLVRQGTLREFRDGSRRLLRTADVAAIVAARDRRDQRQGRSQAQSVAARFPSEQDDRLPPQWPVPVRPGRSAADVSQTPGCGAARPTTVRAGWKDRNFAIPVPRQEPVSRRDVGRPVSSGGRRTVKGRTKPEAAPERQNLSIREWFWAGVTQDRPITIALFAALVLLTLSAVVLGACVLAGML